MGAEESSDDEVESVRSVQFTEFRRMEFISAKNYSVFRGMRKVTAVITPDQ